MKLTRWLLPILAASLVLLIATPVLAIADPDDIELRAVYVFEDCLEAGDRGVLVDYYIDYASLPDETATEAYLVIFIDTDGTTQLGTVAPYAYTDNGYGRGVAWIYFNAAAAASYGLDIASQSSYSIRLVGNPTVPSGWTGDPPSVTTGVDYWQAGGDTAIIVALRVLYYADLLGSAWSVTLLESTATGNRLTSLGVEYFTNVISDLRAIAPAVFSASTIVPDDPALDYTTQFGATMTDGTGTVAGSPITLVEGENTVTITGTGTFILELEQGTVGTATDGTATITGSPVDLVSGTNTITATATGTAVMDVELQTTQTVLTDTIVGTAFDLTTLGEHFGMSRMWMSSIVWFIVILLVCAAGYRRAQRDSPRQAGKITFLLFDVCFIGGIVLSMLPIIAGVLLFLACNLFIGYFVFYKQAHV